MHRAVPTLNSDLVGRIILNPPRLIRRVTDNAPYPQFGFGRMAPHPARVVIEK